MFPERKVLLVVNPISGDVDKDDILNTVIEKSHQLNYDLRIYSTTGEDDLHTIREMVAKLKPERILIAGGDGTVSLVAEAVREPGVIFGLIPAGSANGLAADFELPGSLEAVIDIAFGEKVIGMDAVCINGDISLHLADIGLNALLVKNYEKSDTRGKLGYAKEMLKTLSEHENVSVKITTEEHGVIETDALIVIIANARKYGTGVAINPLGDMSDGLFELVIAKKLDFIETAKILTGSTDFNPDIFQIISVKEALIECTDKEAYFQIDGEYKGMVRRLQANIIKDYIQVAIP